MTLSLSAFLLLLCCSLCLLDGILLHTVVLSVLAALGALFLLWLILLYCRKGHPAWAKLSRFRYAHRGLHDSENGVPENSLPAFRRAVEGGFGAELDVHLTRDGRLAVLHDSSLLRTAGVDVRVEDLTAEEVKAYPLEGTDARIPLLEEVLPLFAGKAPLIIELKVEGDNAAALAQATCLLLERYDLDYCIESFHPTAVRWLAKNRPQICRGQLSQDFLRSRSGLSRPPAFLMTHLLINFLSAPDFIAYNLHHRREPSLLLCRKVWKVQEVSWTVRSQEELEACQADGCLIIFEHFLPR